MTALILWLSVAIGCAMMFARTTRNAAFFALAGSALGLLFHYDISILPAVRYLAILFWAVAVALAITHTLDSRRRGTV